jgi:hypothetical protein
MSKNKKGVLSSSASIDEPLAPETTVPKLLPTQSPAHKLLSLLENDKDFLDILFGKPSSRKSSNVSKSKGSNECHRTFRNGHRIVLDVGGSHITFRNGCRIVSDVRSSHITFRNGRMIVS